MNTAFNRIAIKPVRCTDCQRYIFLEPYRKGEKWHKYLDQFVKVKICKRCIKNYKCGKEVEE